MEDHEVDSRVLDILDRRRGKGQAIPRWDLVEAVFGVKVPAEEQNDNNRRDRQVRDSIERWRKQGRHLCNVGNGQGYYTAATQDEYEEFRRYYLGAAYKKLESVKAMDETADMEWGKSVKVTPQGQMTFLEV